MRGQQHGQVPRGLQVVQHLPHSNAGNRVEACRRLVEEEDPRVVHKTARNLQPPPHSSGERLRLRIAPLHQVHGLQHFLNVLLPLSLGNAVQLRVNAQVLFNSQVLIAGERLRNHPDHAPHRVRLFRDIVPGDDRASRCDRNQRRHHANQRALPRSVRSQQSKYLAIRDRETYALHSLKLPVALDDILHGNRNRHARGRPRFAVDRRADLCCRLLAHCFTSFALGM